LVFVMNASSLICLYTIFFPVTFRTIIICEGEVKDPGTHADQAGVLFL
jgi:hypothetical protein